MTPGTPDPDPIIAAVWNIAERTEQLSAEVEAERAESEEEVVGE